MAKINERLNMDKIIFRGKTIFNGTIGSSKWIESDNFSCINGRWYIGGYKVADETVEQVIANETEKQNEDQ